MQILTITLHCRAQCKTVGVDVEVQTGDKSSPVSQTVFCRNVWFQQGRSLRILFAYQWLDPQCSYYNTYKRMSALIPNVRTTIHTYKSVGCKVHPIKSGIREKWDLKSPWRIQIQLAKDPITFIYLFLMIFVELFGTLQQI